MNLFDEQERLERINKLRNPLGKLNEVIDWEMFRPTLNHLLGLDVRDFSKGGHPRFDVVFMFKLLILQRYYNLSDAETELSILNRFDFQLFLGIDEARQVPDEKTIWLFKDNLSKTGQIQLLFEQFSKLLENQGLIAHEGQIVDASFVEAPKQRNPRDENRQVKEGKVPANWSKHKQAQKDVDARWTIKNTERHYGYKDHVCVDAESKLIKAYQVTAANVHDSQVFGALLDHNETVYADSAYVGQSVDESIKQNICLKAFRNRPLSDVDKAVSRFFSKTRCRVEHVFGFIQTSMKGSTFRGHGLRRAVVNVTLTNLCYNLFRFEQLKRLAS